MKQVSYSLQFKGNAAPKEGSAEGVLAVRATATGGVRTSLAGGDLNEAIDPAGGTAQFESVVTMMSASTFDEQGSIDFGGGNSVRFTTAGQGHVGASAEAGVNSGAVIWQVQDGTGRLSGATGYITSNFFFNAAGEVTDNQLGVFFVK